MANESKRNLKEELVAVLTQHHLLSAADILDQLAQTAREFNKSSVYRALDQLVESEVLCKHYFGEAQAYFELRDHHHAHAYCRVCGRVQMLDCSLGATPAIEGFEIEHHHVTYIGRCEGCTTET